MRVFLAALLGLLLLGCAAQVGGAKGDRGTSLTPDVTQGTLEDPNRKADIHRALRLSTPGR